MQFLIEHIKQLVTVASNGAPVKRGKEMRELGVIEDAAVFIEDGLIHWMGKTDDFTGTLRKDAFRLDATGLVGLPGFVDSHTHLVFAGSRENEFAMRSDGKTYQQIAEAGGGIVSTMNATRAASKKELKKSAERRLDAMLKLGTTVAEIKSGYGLDPDSEMKMLEVSRELAREHYATVVSTFLGAHAFPPEYKGKEEEYVSLICDYMLPHISKKNLAAFCDVFCDKGYFSVEQSKRILTEAKRLGLKLKIHADQLSKSGGAAMAVELGAVSADHLEYTDGEGINALAKSSVVATVLPGVSFFLNTRYPNARGMIDAGVPVAIATDFNPGSCVSYSMPLMMTIACTQMRMTPEEAITASTLNGAAALGISHRFGSIEQGKEADIILYNVPNYRHLVYHFGENFAVKIIKKGVLLEF